MEGMTILYVLLAVIALIVIAALIYWLGNSISHDKANEDPNKQQPTFPAAAIATQENQTEPTELQKPEKVKYVSSVKLRHKKRGGGLGAIGCAMTVFLCLLYIEAYDITVMQVQMLNFYTLTVIAAVLSFFGSFFHDASCVLLVAVALVSAFFLNTDSVFGLIPAVSLCYSHERMKYNVDIEVKKKEMEQ